MGLKGTTMFGLLAWLMNITNDHVKHTNRAQIEYKSRNLRLHNLSDIEVKECLL
jgi:hypothetical protein